MKKKVVIFEKDWLGSIYSSYEWECSVEIITWEHDFEKKQYTIIYKNKHTSYGDKTKNGMPNY